MKDFHLVLRTVVYRVFLSPQIIIQFRNGKLIVIKGKPKTGFLIDCSEIGKNNNLKYGILYTAIGAYNNSIIKASGEISPDVLQQLRNSWSFYA